MKTKNLPRQAAFFLLHGSIYLALFTGSQIKAQIAGSFSQQLKTDSHTIFSAADQFEALKLTSKIFDVVNHSFGYDIYADGRIMVHQPSIPALTGNEGFKNRADAEKVAYLVIGKIRKGEMPPSVSVDEMKKLKVIL